MNTAPRSGPPQPPPDGSRFGPIHSGQIHGSARFDAARGPAAKEAVLATELLRDRLLILIVDDESGIRETLRRFLELLGHEVRTARNPDQALAAVGQVRPAAMILDVRMPSGNARLRTGLDLLAVLRAQPGLGDAPIFLLTGYFLTGDEEADVRRHRATILYKPTNFGDLAARLPQAAGSPVGTGPHPQVD